MMVQRIVMMAVVMVLVALPGLPDRVEAKAVSPDFVELAKRLNPTVVNIRTAKVIKPRANTGRRMPHPFSAMTFSMNSSPRFRRPTPAAPAALPQGAVFRHRLYHQH